MDRNFQLDLDAATTRSCPLMVADRDLRLRSADYAQELDADGEKTAKIRNETQALDLTAALDIDALAALGKAAFTGVDTTLIKKGDLIVLVYTVVTAGTVHPGQVAVTAVFDEPPGRGHGPAWAG